MKYDFVKIKACSIFFFICIASACLAQDINPRVIYKSETLIIEKLSENSYLHISYLETETYGKVACNGVIVIDNGEAIVFDTPSSDNDSRELIDWIEQELNCKIVAVVATHFHIDCLGGLAEFHQRNIPSYALNQTIELTKADQKTLPQHGFDQFIELNVGAVKVVSEFLGEGHTRDNIVAYFPSEKLLFGGCLIKAIGAGKGNVADANVGEWSNTVAKVKAKYLDVKIVVPGHGKSGGQALLDYTIELFKNE